MAKRRISKKARKEIEKAAKKHPAVAIIIALVLVIVIAAGCCLLHYKRVITIPFLEGIIPQEEVLDDGDDYTVTVQQNVSAGGTVSGAGTFAVGETATLAATVNVGYRFLGWYKGTQCVSTNPVYTFTVTDDVAIEAKFEVDAGGGTGGAGGNEGGGTSSADLQIHFLELGNKNSGDCTLIKTGNTEVLIDAGSRKGSAATIVPYIEQYCTDGVLEYVIATHAHQDHIAGFVGTTTADGVFESFACGTIIDFARTEATTEIYTEYVSARDAEIAAGANHYTALECWNNQNGAQRSYTLGEGITMNILYQKYYEQDASSENDYSVCMLLSQGSNHYLFTGDLEEHGEASLVANNTLPKVKLFKAGHHGIYTANTDTLLSVIRPEIVCVCCCCGSMEYIKNQKDLANDFPSQTFINNVAPYTDKIYVTSIATGTATYDSDGKITAKPSGFTSLNGNIVVTSSGGEVTVNCSNNNTIFKETQWFKDNRTWPQNGVGSSG